MLKAGILFGEERRVEEDLRAVKLAEELGYDSVWFGEHAGIRDALTLMGMSAVLTKALKIGSCAINAYTRNVGTVAAAANTLSSAAPGRIMLSIASGEEILENFGIKKASPLKEMKEFITALKLLMSGKPVEFSGDFIKLRNARTEKAIDVPVYLAATGFKMLSLGAEIADGIMLNFLVDDNYLEKAHAIIGGKKAFQLIAVSLNRDQSYDDAKRFMAKFFYLAPEFFRSIVGPDVIRSVQRVIKGWPPPSDELDLASKLVPDEAVSKLMAAGSIKEIESYVHRVAERWGSYPVFYIVSKDHEFVMNQLSKIII